MIIDWFAGPSPGMPGWSLALSGLADLTVLLVSVWAVHVVLGRRRVLVRSGLWNAVLLASIAVPALALGLPRMTIACLPAPTTMAAAAGPAGLIGGTEQAGDSATRVGPPAESEVKPLTERPAVTRPEARRPGASESVIGPGTTMLIGLYAVGALVLLSRLVGSLAMVARLKDAAIVIEDPCWTRRLSHWRHRLGMARPVRLLRSADVRVPMVLGWLRPAIILPGGEEDPEWVPESHKDAVLLHELAHLRRGDDLWNLLQQLVQILYWPHPLVWMMARTVAEVREQACDDLCVRWLGGAAEYRSALITAAGRLVADRGRSASAVPGLAMARTSSSALLRRLRWIERTPGTSACILRWPGRLAIFLGVLGVTLFLVAVEPTRGRAVSSARQSTSRVGATPAAGAPVRAYNQPVPLSARLQTKSLTVLDDETGQPLADVEVRILNYVDVRFHVFPTDDRGRLRFEYPWLGDRPVGHIEVRKNGYVPVRYDWGFDGGSKPPDALALRLRRGTTMGGIVVAAGDRPIEGVIVVMTVTRYGPAKRAALPAGHEKYYEVPSRTGPDGRWRTDSVPPEAEEVSLQLIHPDYVCDSCTTVGSKGRRPKLAALRDQSDRQVLLKGLRIEGRVLDDRGRPISGARVVDATNGLTFLEHVWRASTDPEGHFHIHLPRGNGVKLTTQAQGHGPVTIDVAADPGHPSVEFRLSPGKRLRGRVVDPRGRPIAGAQVRIPNPSGSKGVQFTQWTDQQGRFEWDCAPAEPVAFSIGADGYLLPDGFVQLSASDNEAMVVLKPKARLDVLDAGTGKPIPIYMIRIGRPAPGAKRTIWGESLVVTAPDHLARSLAAEKGPYQLEITANGYEPAQIAVPGEEASLREVIKLEKASE